MEKEEQVLKKIGDQLIKLRIKKGFSSYERFAVEYDLSRMAYWKIEKGKANITMRTLLKLLAIHKISIEDFFSKDF